MKTTCFFMASPRTLLDLHEGHRKSVNISIIGPYDIGGFVSEIGINVNKPLANTDAAHMGNKYPEQFVSIAGSFACNIHRFAHNMAGRRLGTNRGIMFGAPERTIQLHRFPVVLPYGFQAFQELAIHSHDPTTGATQFQLAKVIRVIFGHKPG
jgi:hypothetical protein